MDTVLGLLGLLVYIATIVSIALTNSPFGDSFAWTRGLSEEPPMPELGVNIAWYPGFTHHVTWAALWDFMQAFQARGAIAARRGGTAVTGVHRSSCRAGGTSSAHR